MAALRQAIYAICEAEQPVTERRIFYVLVSRGLIPKTEPAYKGVVIRLATQMRLAGELPYEWIADRTRAILRVQGWSSVDEWLTEISGQYRRDLWKDQPDYVIVFSEKGGLVDALSEPVNRNHVPIVASVGYSSHSLINQIALGIWNSGRPAFGYWLGDYDPSGVDLQTMVEREVPARLQQLASKHRRAAPSFTVTRLAVTAEQITQYNLPTRPTKQTDSRAKAFGSSESVEVDALPMDVLRDLVREAIEGHLDRDVLVRVKRVEAEERASVSNFIRQLRRAAS